MWLVLEFLLFLGMGTFPLWPVGSSWFLWVGVVSWYGLGPFMGDLADD